MDNWQALDAFCEEWPLSEPDEPEAAMLTQLRAAATGLAAHTAELHIEELLEQLRDRALSGRGEIVQRRGMYGVEWLYSLVWPAAADRRPERAAMPGDLHLSIWLGYHESNGRACVRILGEKRLEAYLPVSEDKLRSAIIAGLRAPAFAAYPEPPPPAAPNESAAHAPGSAFSPESDEPAE